MTSIPLSPVDYIFTGEASQPITFAFSYRKKIDPELLKKSLKATLGYFPILQCQLHKISESDYEYRITPDGLNFDIRESHSAFKESDRIGQYITPVNTIEGNPLTRITLTQTPEASVLAISISHALVDGFSYFHFLSSWAIISWGEKFLSPYLDRRVVSSFDENNFKDTSADDIYTFCGLFYGGQRHQMTAGSMRSERMFIPEETIRSHIGEVKRVHQISCTENDVITAILWKKYLSLWNEEDVQHRAYVTCPFDFRRALPDFPKNYFGCAIVFATAEIGFKDLVTASVEDLSLLIRNSVSRMKPEYILNSMRALENLRRQKGLSAMAELHLRHARHGMIVTNLTRMPIQDLDFGFGSPEKFITYAEITRSAAILPAEKGVEVIIVNPT